MPAPRVALKRVVDAVRAGRDAEWGSILGYECGGAIVLPPGSKRSCAALGATL